MSFSAAVVIGIRGAESRQDNKDCLDILIPDAAGSDDRPMVSEPVEIAQVELPDVRDALDRHDDPFQAEPPREDGRLESEGRGHLGPEDPAPAELHPTSV